MDDDLQQLLKSLGLTRVLEILGRELAKAEQSEPSCAEFLARLLREEHHAQQDRFLDFRVKRARLPERWSLETFPWKQQPGVKRKTIEQLAELDFIARATSVVFVAPTGTGKTGLASAILLKVLPGPRIPATRPASMRVVRPGDARVRRAGLAARPASPGRETLRSVRQMPRLPPS